MKTSQNLLVALTIAFSAFILGLFAGRNLNRTPVQIQSLPAVTAAETATHPAPTESSIININTASSEQLQTLPGIGPVLADRIVAYRDEHGLFESAGALMNVSGIGEKKLESIWDLITTGG